MLSKSAGWIVVVALSMTCVAEAGFRRHRGCCCIVVPSCSTTAVSAPAGAPQAAPVTESTAPVRPTLTLSEAVDDAPMNSTSQLPSAPQPRYLPRQQSVAPQVDFTAPK